MPVPMLGLLEPGTPGPLRRSVGEVTEVPARRYRWLLHVDLDQFQVSVERLRDPALVGRAVVVGGDGDPTQARKVVTCASYEARDRGVRAGMPLRGAYRKFPDATYLPVDMAAYEAASAQVMDTLRASGYPVEVWGWDEAYLGIFPLADDGTPLPGSGEVPTDREILGFAAGLRDTVADQCGLGCRVGISDNKQRAKMATGFAKRGVVESLIDPTPPPGVFLLDGRNWLPLMGPSPARELWSVGPRTADKLAEMDIHTVNALMATPRADLIARFGQHQGNWLYVLCRGGGDATITVAERDAKSHSKSKTFDSDLTDPAQIQSAAAELGEQLIHQIREEGRIALRVAVTVRTSSFYTRTRSRVLRPPTVDPAAILPVIADLLELFEQGRPVRLLGIRLDLEDLS